MGQYKTTYIMPVDTKKTFGTKRLKILAFLTALNKITLLVPILAHPLFLFQPKELTKVI